MIVGVRLRLLGAISKGLFIICVPILFLSLTIGWEIGSFWPYRYCFEKYNVSRATGLSRSELENVATKLTSYFGSTEDYVQVTLVRDGQSIELFTPEEVIHFSDVKELVRLNRRLALAALGYVLIFAAVSLILKRRKCWRQLGRALIAGGGATLTLMLVVGLVVMLDFDWFFLQFHLLSFSNEYWSSAGYMVLLFPQGFWYDMALFTALITCGLALVFGGVGFGLLGFARKKLES